MKIEAIIRSYNMPDELPWEGGRYTFKVIDELPDIRKAGEPYDKYDRVVSIVSLEVECVRSDDWYYDYYCVVQDDEDGDLNYDWVAVRKLDDEEEEA